MRPDDSSDDATRVDADAQVHGETEAFAKRSYLMQQAHSQT